MKYKILGTNHIKLFVHIMTKLKINHGEAMGDSINEDTIQEINEIAEENNIIILALPDDVLFNKNMGRKSQFVPINKDSGMLSGVFIPIKIGKDIGDYDNFIDVPILSSMDNISNLSKICHEYEAGEKTEMGHIGEVPSKEKAKWKGRSNRKKTIGKEDIEKMNKLLRPGDDKDIDVNDFLKLIE